MVQKSDGGYGYDSTDITAVQYRLRELGSDWIIYITDTGQQMHFQLVLLVAQMAGWAKEVRLKTGAHMYERGREGRRETQPVALPNFKFQVFGPRGARVEWIGFGVVQDKNGRRFKTRSGGTVKLTSLLDEAKDRAYESLKKRQEEGKGQMAEEEMKEAAGIVGYSAVKYFDLKNQRVKDYKFDYDAMLNFEGDTAVYLHFAQVR